MKQDMFIRQSQIHNLLFVYNADSGIGNLILDGTHKLLSPSTYECSLCELTFGIVGERRDWKRFRKQFEVPMKFLHRDEFTKEYASKFMARFTFPIVLAETAEGLEVFIGTAELNGIEDAGELIELIEERARL